MLQWQQYYQEKVDRHHDMSAVYHCMQADVFNQMFPGVLNQDPESFAVTIYKKEQHDRPKEQRQLVKLRQWYDVMNKDDVNELPCAQEDLLEDILDGDIGDF